MGVIPLKLVVQELERELTQRKKWYPVWVRDGKNFYTQALADERTKLMVSAIFVFKAILAGRKPDPKKIDLKVILTELKREVECRKGAYPKRIQAYPSMGPKLNKQLLLMQKAVEVIQDITYTGSHLPLAAIGYQADLFSISNAPISLI